MKILQGAEALCRNPERRWSCAGLRAAVWHCHLQKHWGKKGNLQETRGLWDFRMLIERILFGTDSGVVMIFSLPFNYEVSMNSRDTSEDLHLCFEFVAVHWWAAQTWVSVICSGSAVLLVCFTNTFFHLAFAQSFGCRFLCSWESPMSAGCFPAPAAWALGLVVF